MKLMFRSLATHSTRGLTTIGSKIVQALRRQPNSEKEIATSIECRGSQIIARFAFPPKYSGAERTVAEGLYHEKLPFTTESAAESADHRVSLVAIVSPHSPDTLFALRRVLVQCGGAADVNKLEAAVFKYHSEFAAPQFPESLLRMSAERSREKFKENGICVVPYSNVPLSKAEWFLIESIAYRLTAQKAVIEPTYSRAGIMRNGTITSLETATLSGILKRSRLGGHISAITGHEIVVNDAQVNVLRKGDFMAGHNHKFTLPFAVLHLGMPYEGGAYFEGANEASARRITVPLRSLVISQGERYHGVEEVTGWTRYTIPIFVKERQS